MSQKEDAKLLKELASMRERFTSLEAMADALRVHEGFEDLNRSTLSRWMKQPTSRARRALSLLNSDLETVRLRVGETKALSVMPASMLLWETKAGTPYGILARKYGIHTEIYPTSHGKDGLELLTSGKADLAVVPGDLLHWFPSYCARLCLLARVYIAGVSTRLIDSAFDLRGCRFGILSGSSFATRLSNESRNWGFELPPPLPLGSLKDCVHALVDGRIQGVAGWEPFVSHVRRAAGRQVTLHPIPQGALGWFEMHVAVNLRTANPSGVRAYLVSLEEAVRFTNARKSVTSFHAEIAARYKMAASEVRQILTNIIFGLDELEPTTVLKLWEREAASGNGRKRG
jgi:hypothetical protein